MYLKTKMTNKRDIFLCICKFDTLKDQCDSEFHFQRPKWWFALFLRVYLGGGFGGEGNTCFSFLNYTSYENFKK